ncbi:MAG: diacylglycerol/lipid kinase family protein [Nitrospinota bacterium]
MNYMFIVNKHSGDGFGQKELSRMENYFKKSIGSFEYVMPENREDAVKITRKLLKKDVDRIVAVGGDGTINAIVNGFFENGKIIREDAALIVTEAGSGCDYYKSVARGSTVQAWMELVTNCTPKSVDVGVIRYKDDARGDRYFLNMASIGMIADVVRIKEKQAAYVPKMLRYNIPTIWCLFACKSHELEIETIEKSFHVEALAVSIAKGRYAGGGMQFGLDVLLDDGMFEVTIFEKTGPISMALKLGKLYKGDYRHVPGIRKEKTSRITFRSKKPVQCEFDGDVYGTTDLTMTVLPKALKVCFPNQAT